MNAPSLSVLVCGRLGVFSSPLVSERATTTLGPLQSWLLLPKEERERCDSPGSRALVFPGAARARGSVRCFFAPIGYLGPSCSRFAFSCPFSLVVQAIKAGRRSTSSSSFSGRGLVHHLGLVCPPPFFASCCMHLWWTTCKSMSCTALPSPPPCHSSSWAAAPSRSPSPFERERLIRHGSV